MNSAGNSGYIVLSASRMTDMPEFYPYKIIEETEKRIHNGLKIHTLVLWTKYPKALIKEPLHDYLIQLKKKQVQLYIQLTISGMGQLKAGYKSNGAPLILEPFAPKYRESLQVLPDIITLVEKPERIRLRVDPIIKIADSKNFVFSNIKLFPEILSAAAKLGIKDFSFSFLEKGIHKKVDRRFEKTGCKINPPDSDERNKTASWLKQLEEKFNINIHACCVAGFKESKCIDGELLQRLHDQKIPVSVKQLRRRKLCGCTQSTDLGGWPPAKCFSGCDYCYANPLYAE
ncbi:MAG: DUF1848 family protein [Bacteroidia bacterium]|nr:DUF1848 family protein [Bacteroidia bacterium]